jgi:hypothetical protein
VKSEMFSLILKNLRDCSTRQQTRVDVPLTSYHKLEIVVNSFSQTVNYIDLIAFTESGGTFSVPIYCMSCPVNIINEKQIAILNKLIKKKMADTSKTEMEKQFFELTLSDNA